MCSSTLLSIFSNWNELSYKKVKGMVCVCLLWEGKTSLGLKADGLRQGKKENKKKRKLWCTKYCEIQRSIFCQELNLPYLECVLEWHLIWCGVLCLLCFWVWCEGVDCMQFFSLPLCYIQETKNKTNWTSLHDMFLQSKPCHSHDTFSSPLNIHDCVLVSHADHLATES